MFIYDYVRLFFSTYATDVAQPNLTNWEHSTFYDQLIKLLRHFLFRLESLENIIEDGNKRGGKLDMLFGSVKGCVSKLEGVATYLIVVITFLSTIFNI